MNIKKLFVLPVAMLLSMVSMQSCSADDADIEPTPSPSTFTGYISEVDSYGALIPNFSAEELKTAGFDYTDIVNVKIGDNLSFDMPFATGFNEVGVLECNLCDYNRGGTLSIGILNGNFAERVGGKAGDRIVITLKQKQGYKDMYEAMHSEYDTIFSKYGTAERFANFREVTTTGMARGVLYRSSNPLNPKDNAARCSYADKLAESVGIQTEIDLADTDVKVENYHNRADFNSPYCYALFTQHKVITLGLSADMFSDNVKQKMGNGLRFMINNKPPYLVHCNEGKDRCGFVSMLLEALAGANYDELVADYMVTFDNFYHVQPDTHEYQVRKELAIDRLIWLLGNPSSIKDGLITDWTHINPSSIDLETAARNYVMDCGLSESECNQLCAILKGSESVDK